MTQAIVITTYFLDDYKTRGDDLSHYEVKQFKSMTEGLEYVQREKARKIASTLERYNSYTKLVEKISIFADNDRIERFYKLEVNSGYDEDEMTEFVLTGGIKAWSEDLAFNANNYKDSNYDIDILFDQVNEGEFVVRQVAFDVIKIE